MDFITEHYYTLSDGTCSHRSHFAEGKTSFFLDTFGRPLQLIPPTAFLCTGIDLRIPTPRYSYWASVRLFINNKPQWHMTLNDDSLWYNPAPHPVTILGGSTFHVEVGLTNPNCLPDDEGVLFGLCGTLVYEPPKNLKNPYDPDGLILWHSAPYPVPKEKRWWRIKK